MINDAGLIWVIVALVFAFTLAGRFVVRRFTVRFRPIAAYDALPNVAADAVESAKRLHFSFGSSTLGDSTTITTLASAEIMYRMAERVAMGRQTPLVTLSNPLTLPLAQDTLRRAYEYRQNMPYYRSNAAAWFPQGSRALTFAAGVAAFAADYDVDSNLVMGKFDYELALIAESALRYDQGLIAHSDRVEGQAIAYAMADQALIGEELYVGPAYLNGTALERGGILAQEVLRWLVILAILAIALQAAL